MQKVGKWRKSMFKNKIALFIALSISLMHYPTIRAYDIRNTIEYIKNFNHTYTVFGLTIACMSGYAYAMHNLKNRSKSFFINKNAVEKLIAKSKRKCSSLIATDGFYTGTLATMLQDIKFPALYSHVREYHAKTPIDVKELVDRHIASLSEAEICACAQTLNTHKQKIVMSLDRLKQTKQTLSDLYQVLRSQKERYKKIEPQHYQRFEKLILPSIKCHIRYSSHLIAYFEAIQKSPIGIVQEALTYKAQFESNFKEGLAAAGYNNFSVDPVHDNTKFVLKDWIYSTFKQSSIEQTQWITAVTHISQFIDVITRYAQNLSEYTPALSKSFYHLCDSTMRLKLMIIASQEYKNDYEALKAQK